MKPLRARNTVLIASLSALTALAAALPAWAEQPQSESAASEERITTGADPGAVPPPLLSEAPALDGTPPPPDAVARGGARAGLPAAEPATASERKRRRSLRTRRRLGDRTLREGMRGSDVRHLQKVLTGMNFDTKVDGRYGRGTKRSVRRYDRWKERKVNGVVHMQQAKRMKQRYRRGVRYRKHVFPVRGPHDFGSVGSRFGAPRSGHRHQGQDVAAAEGTRIVAVHEGRVATRAYQASGAGNYVVIHGKDRTDSVYMHMRDPARVRPGERVMAGQVIGRVGNTGASSGAHLHFELWTRHWYAGGDPFDPLRKLKRWDRRT